MFTFMKHFLIRYGVFCILALMLSGIGWMATHYTVRVKLPVTLCGTKNGCTAWIPLTDTGSYSPGDSLHIVQTSVGNLSFRIDSIWQEGNYRVYCLQAPSAAPPSPKDGHTMLTGYVIAGRESMGTLILRKFQFR